MQAFRIHIPGVLLLLLVTAPVRQTAGADEPPPRDHIARAGLLLKEFPLPAWEAAPLRQDVHHILCQRPPTLRDTGPIRSVKAFFCDEDVPPMERTKNLLLIAQWQRDAGLNDEAVTTLYAALDAAEKAYTSQDPPEMGYYTNRAERIAHHLIEWNGDEDKVLHAVELGGSVRLHHPRMFDPQYTRVAAEVLNHALMVRLVEHEKTALGRARAWADAAIGYKESGDGQRAVAAAKRCVEEMDRIPSEEVDVHRMGQDWRFETAFILSNVGEKDLAKQVLQHADKGNRLSATDLLSLATAWLRIGEEEEASGRIDRYFDEMSRQALTAEESAWGRAKGWITIALAYAARGDLEEAEKALANIPAESQNRMRGVRFVGRLLLDRGDPESREAARDLFTRHARFAASAEKTPDDEHLGWLEETVYCAREAARAGAIDAVEEQFLPTMTPKEQQTVIRSLAAYSTELSLDERIRRFVTPQSDPTERVNLLGLMAERLRDNDTLYQVECMIPEEKECDRWKMGWTLTILAEHRQSLNHWERARELFERALACTSDIQLERWRAGHLNSLMVRAWMHGHEDLARKAAEQLIDLVWETRAERIEAWKPGSRARCVLAAKQLLEATKRQGSETAVERQR